MTHKDGEFEPVWNHKIELDIEDPINDKIKIEVFDEDDGSNDDLIGFMSVKVSSFILNAHEPQGNDDWHSLFYNNERIGLLHTHSSFLSNKITYSDHIKTTE